MAKGPLRVAIESLLLSGPFPEASSRAIEFVLERLEDSAVDSFYDLIAPALDDPELEGEVKALLAHIFNPRGQAGITALAGFGGQAGFSMAGGLFAPLQRLLNYAIDRKRHSARFDPAAAFAAARRFPDSAGRFLFDPVDLGWDETRLQAWGELTRPLLPESALMRLWFRFPDQRDGIYSELFARGYTDQRIQEIVESSTTYPGVQDLITFAVREAYDEGLSARFQHDADFPAEFAAEASRLGLADGAARLYWRSHWNLISPTLAFEMFHRARAGTLGIDFTQSDLDDLLKAQDYAPFWRERLRLISFAQVTRVDTRRLYLIGRWGPEQVLASYKAQGYSDDDAEALTDFAIQDAVGNERELSRSIIERQYKRRAILREEAKALLVGIRYPPELADFILDAVDLAIAEEMTAEELDRVEFLYVEGELDDVSVYDELGHLNLTPEQIQRRLAVWDVRRRKKVSLPTVSELDDLYFRGIIELPELADELLKRNWAEGRILWHLEKLDQESIEQAEKNAERAAKEEERLRTSELKSAYMIERAALDVQISQVKLNIADFKLARHSIDDADLLMDMNTAIEELKRQIAVLNVSKANVTQDYRTQL